MAWPVRHTLFVLNFVLFVVGIIVLTVGISLSDSKTEQLEINFLQNNFFYGTYSAVTAIFGFCGIVKINFTILIIYAALLLFIFALEVLNAAITIHLYAFNSAAYNVVVKNEIQNALRNYVTDISSKEKLDSIQKTLRCCGVSGPKDWESFYLPPSCCKNDAFVCEMSKSYKVGCLTPTYNSYLSTNVTAAVVGVLFSILQITIFVFTIKMLRIIKTSDPVSDADMELRLVV